MGGRDDTMIRSPSHDDTSMDFFRTLLDKILFHAESPDLAGQTLIQETRGLTGSKAVMVLMQKGSDDPSSYISFPDEQNPIFETPDSDDFLRAVMQVETAIFWDQTNDESPAKKVLESSNLENCFSIPLVSKNIRFGTLIFFGLPSTIQTDPLVTIMKNLSPVLALIFRSASDHKETERLIQERTQYSTRLEREITERKKVESVLRDSRDYYLKLFDDFPNPIWRSGTSAKCDYFNKEWLSFTGRTFEQEKGDGWAEGVHPDDFDRCLKIYLDSFNAVQPFEMEYRLRHHDGTYHWLLDYGKPFFDLNGTFSGYIGACYDITCRKQAERALQKANEKIRILSSITRHDILNQVNALQMYLESSLKFVTDPKTLEYIKNEIIITDLIGKQIEFTKFYENIGVKEPQWQDITSVIHFAAKKHHQMEQIAIKVDTNGLMVYSDLLIGKVFYNLLDNSIRHGEHVTSIIFSFNETKEGVVIIYQDNGIGVPDADKPNLFQKGFGKNTGLGLFLSREILSITGITITETGESGKGVRFEIHVPKHGYRLEQ